MVEISPSSRMMGSLFISRRSVARGYAQGVWRIPVDGDPTTHVLWQREVPENTRSLEYLSVSPDGRWILYSATEPADSDIMLVDNYR